MEPTPPLNDSNVAAQLDATDPSILKFTEQLIVESLGRNWRLTQAFRFYYSKTTKKESILIDVIVPQGFITDFASTPRWTYVFFPPVGIYNKAAAMHDYLYNVYCTIPITRRQADLFFLQAMEVLRTPKLQRYLMYLGVRLGGARRFRQPQLHWTNPQHPKLQEHK